MKLPELNRQDLNASFPDEIRPMINSALVCLLKIIVLNTFFATNVLLFLLHLCYFATGAVTSSYTVNTVGCSPLFISAAILPSSVRMY